VRALCKIVTLSLAFFYLGCSREPGKPLSFYLSDQEPTFGSGVIPATPATLVINKLQFVITDAAQHIMTIKFFPADASTIEKLTIDNFGKTVVMVQGTNVLCMSRISVPVGEKAAMIFPVRTNLDFEIVTRELLNLSR
jgi:hypothetical protein